jgi:ABC-type sugar transport system permease subunit
LAFLAAFTYRPVLRVLGESFMVGRFAGQHALGLDNYRRLFADPHFARAAWKNAANTVGTIVPSLVLALLFALRLNAVVGRRVYGVPFQNSTPLLYYNVAAFTEAGLDPDHPPATGPIGLLRQRSSPKPRAARVSAGG